MESDVQVDTLDDVVVDVANDGVQPIDSLQRYVLTSVSVKLYPMTN